MFCYGALIWYDKKKTTRWNINFSCNCDTFLSPIGVVSLYSFKIGRWPTILYIKNGITSTKIVILLYISKPSTCFSQVSFWLSIYVFLIWHCHLFLGWSWFCLSVLLQLVSVPSLLLSFYENFQSRQWDTKWKTSFEFQRPDRTHCFYQQSKGPLDKKVPSELIIHAESPPGCCFLSPSKANSQGCGWREQEAVARLDKRAESLPPC